MAITFDWYENPLPSDKQEEEKTLHPRLRFNGMLDTEDLRTDIQMRTSLSSTDVTAVLDALSTLMGKALTEGMKIHLDGIGYFYPTLTSTGPVTAETKNKSSKVRLKGIGFRADKKLKNSLGAIHVRRMKRDVCPPAPSDKEMELRLEEYFRTHPFIRRAEFQSLFQLTKSTAIRHINRLIGEGKLENAATQRHPVYVWCGQK